MGTARVGAALVFAGALPIGWSCAPSASDFAAHAHPGDHANDPNAAIADSSPSDPSNPDGASPSDASLDADAAHLPRPATVRVQGGTFAFAVRVPDGGTQSSTATLDYAFDVDTTEVTVGAFKQWVQAGAPFPACAGQSQCSLDPGGPYETSMQWPTALNSTPAARQTPWTSPDAGCVDYALTHDAQTYFVSDDAPMNCVNWFHAVAYCAWRGMRLLTETEMHFLTTGHGDGRKYPWGNDDPSDCSRAIWSTSSHCGFPVAAGSTRAGASKDGVLDLAGSLNEWLWDRQGPYPIDAGTNYAGPPWSGDPAARSCRGGGYWSTAEQLRNEERRFGAEYYLTFQESHKMWSGIGFRCAKTAR